MSLMNCTRSNRGYRIGKLVSKRMSDVEDRACLARRADSLRHSVRSTEHAGDQLVDGLVGHLE